MQTLAVRPGSEPVLGAPLARDAEVACKYFADIESLLQSCKPAEIAALRAQALGVKERFFRRHAAALYDEATEGGAGFLRVGD